MSVVGSDRCTVLRQKDEATKTATILSRMGTQNSTDDVERVVDDAVNVIKVVAKDSRLLANAGAAEIALSRQLQLVAEKTPGLNQYGILHAAHAQIRSAAGVDIGSEGNGIFDAKVAGIFDALAAKRFVLKLTTHAALTLLSVDQLRCAICYQSFNTMYH
ncbi:T-complex protein 1 subunit theta [Geranomyces variabilis]|nr:T-complex protein 1 subunit theta [Geranomyces variabilis]